MDDIGGQFKANDGDGGRGASQPGGAVCVLPDQGCSVPGAFLRVRAYMILLDRAAVNSNR